MDVPPQQTAMLALGLPRDLVPDAAMHDAHDHDHPHDHGHGHDHDHPPAHAPGQHHHDHDHGHGWFHHHQHHHAVPDAEAGFPLGIALNLGFVGVEVVAGLLAGSMALIADAGHNLSDVLGLALAWFGAHLARRPPTPRRSWGWHRASILAALGNATLLLVAVGAIALEAVQRLLTPEPVATGIVLWTAAIGVIINAGTALLFARGREKDLNRRGAFLHMAADAVVSLGVIIGALVMGWTGWLWLDPLLGLVIAAVILLGSWNLLREALDLAMDAVPRGVDVSAVRAWLRDQPGVAEVHDLHIWALGTTRVALSAHLVRPEAAMDDGFILATRDGLRQRFAIHHATLQVEIGDEANPCPQRGGD